MLRVKSSAQDWAVSVTAVTLRAGAGKPDTLCNRPSFADQSWTRPLFRVDREIKGNPTCQEAIFPGFRRGDHETIR